MDDELKRYLDAMEARIMSAMERMQSQIVSELKAHEGEKTLDAMARKLEGEDDPATDSDDTRIQPGH